jgi:hypothetical protein
MPFETKLARSARDRGLDSHPSANRKTVDSRPKPCHTSRKLVADHKWLFYLVITNTTIQKVVDSRPTYANGQDLEQNLSRTGCRNRNVV